MRYDCMKDIHNFDTPFFISIDIECTETNNVHVLLLDRCIGLVHRTVYATEYMKYLRTVRRRMPEACFYEGILLLRCVFEDYL